MSVFVLQETLSELEEHPSEPSHMGINKMYTGTHFKYVPATSFHCMPHLSRSGVKLCIQLQIILHPPLHNNSQVATISWPHP